MLRGDKKATFVIYKETSVDSNKGKRNCQGGMVGMQMQMQQR